MKIAILGINGRMGSRIYQVLVNKYDVVGITIEDNFKEKITDVELLIDFSSKTSFEKLKVALENKIDIISGTTGFLIEEINELREIAKRNKCYFYSSFNFAKGITSLDKLLTYIKKDYQNIEIIESHNKTKLDKPSGTSILIADKLSLSKDSIQSLRMIDKTAKHEIICSTEYERLTIVHEVFNKEAFVEGFLEIFNKYISKRK